MTNNTKAKKLKQGEPDDITLLYRISKAMAAVKDGRELLKIIVEETQPAFGFYDIGLMVLDKSAEFYLDWSVFYEQINPSASNVAQREARNYKFAADDKLIKYALERAATEKKPYIEYLSAQIIEEFSDFLQLPIEIAHGYKQFLVAALKFGGKTFGFLTFNSLSENHFENCDFELFQAIADLVAVAVANITANEEIIEREREKSVLLSISQAIATIQNHEQLFKVIFERIQPVFGFHDVGLFVFSKDGRQITDWAVAYEHISPSKGNRQLKRFEMETLAVKESPLQVIIERLADADAPLIFSYSDGYVNSVTDSEFREKLKTIIEDGGYQEFLATILKSGGKMLGVLFFNSKQKDFFQAKQFNLFQSFADQIAVAVANITANEEIAEREREKSVLLSISEVIATVRSKKDLLQLIIEKIKPVFNFYDCGIFVFDRDQKTLEDLAVSFPDISPSEASDLLLEQNGAKFDYAGSVWEQGFELMRATAGKPIIFDYSTNDISGWNNYVQAAVMEQIGYEESLMTILGTGGEELGVFALNSLAKGTFNETQFSLFQNIANQMAVAVSNILANDEIQRHLAEITDLKKRLEAENKYLVEEVGKNYNFEEIIGTSPKLQQVFEIIETVAPTDATVLIQGETGTGKELVARAIHNRSTRNERPLIKINCAALPRELVESELFGHERGSFTGAIEKRIGKFELASGGTILLDEIGELPLEMQVKLLRVLQEKEIERLGGKGVIKLDLRVVAATNRNLAQEVQAGRFRADLYYRLCTVELFMPNLRERRQDIEPLTMYFAEKYAAKFSRRIERISSKMLAELHAYDFPGNIRELEHIVEHAVIFSKNEKLILPRSLTGNTPNAEIVSTAEPKTSSPHKPSAAESQSLQTIEREHIMRVLNQTSGRIKGKRGAAEILGLNPATVYFRMKKLGIERSKN